MKVLVTGGAGYIGSHVVNQLLAAGHQPVVIDNLITGFRDAIPANVPFYELDIADLDGVKKIILEHKLGSLIHFAASILVEESMANPIKYYENNSLKGLRLFTLCQQLGVKHIVFSSTAAVYGNLGRPAKENDALSPLSPYGRSKLMSEWALQDLAKATGTFSYAILRYFNVAGANTGASIGPASRTPTHLIKILTEAGCGLREKVQIYGDDYDTKDGTCIRDYVHVVDLADAHILAFESLAAGRKSEIYNCGYGHGYSVLEVIRSFRDTIGIDLNVEKSPRRPGDVGQIVADPSKIRAELGWTPKFDDLEKISRSAFTWEKNLAELRKSGLWL
jgi:UDP-glucose 4-epimerase